MHEPDGRRVGRGHGRVHGGARGAQIVRVVSGRRDLVERVGLIDVIRPVRRCLQFDESFAYFKEQGLRGIEQPNISVRRSHRVGQVEAGPVGRA